MKNSSFSSFFTFISLSPFQIIFSPRSLSRFRLPFRPSFNLIFHSPFYIFHSSPPRRSDPDKKSGVPSHHVFWRHRQTPEIKHECEDTPRGLFHVTHPRIPLYFLNFGDFPASEHTLVAYAVAVRLPTRNTGSVRFHPLEPRPTSPSDRDVCFRCLPRFHFRFRLRLKFI